MESPFFAFPDSFIATEGIAGISLEDFDGTYYTFRVTSDSMSWFVKKRYSDFIALHKHMQDGGANPPTLPGKLSRSGRSEKLRSYVEKLVQQQEGMPENVKAFLKNFFEMNKDIRERASRNSSAFQTIFADTVVHQEQEMCDLREQLRVKTELADEYQRQISKRLDRWMHDQVEVLKEKLDTSNRENRELRQENGQLSKQVEDLVAVVDHHQKSHKDCSQICNGKSKTHRRSLPFMRRRKPPPENEASSITANREDTWEGEDPDSVIPMSSAWQESESAAEAFLRGLSGKDEVQATDHIRVPATPSPELEQRASLQKRPSATRPPAIPNPYM
jgi:hypothetical protein